MCLQEESFHRAPTPPGRLRPSRRWALPLTPGVAPLNLLVGKTMEEELGSVVPKGPSAQKHGFSGVGSAEGQVQDKG